MDRMARRSGLTTTVICPFTLGAVARSGVGAVLFCLTKGCKRQHIHDKAYIRAIHLPPPPPSNARALYCVAFVCKNVPFLVVFFRLCCFCCPLVFLSVFTPLPSASRSQIGLTPPRIWRALYSIPVAPRSSFHVIVCCVRAAPPLLSVFV